MIKRAILALALTAAATVAHAAGTVPGFSLTPQFNLSGAVMPGCKLFVIQSGTVATPQNSYQDTGLTVAQPNPLTCDASGRLPQWFVADGLIKVRLTDKNGLQVFVGDNLLVIGPSSGGGGGGGTIDPTTIASTGDVKASYAVGSISGWVRMNGRTIGSATSGATERANSDTQALFTYLWATDANLAVSGGRGANAAADWAANKTIALPDGRGRVIAGLDDMGNTAAGRLTATYFGASGSCSGVLGITLGASCGGESQTLTASQIPSIASSGGVSTNSTPNNVLTGQTTTTLTSGGTGANFQGIANGTGSSGTLASTGSASVTSTNTGGTPHPQVQPTMLITYFIKL
jgi:microcystin-dependent protein